MTMPPGSRHELADLWLRIVFAEGPLDRAAAEQSIRTLYRIAGEPEPRHWLWLDTLAEAANCAFLILLESALHTSPELREDWIRRYGHKYSARPQLQTAWLELANAGGTEVFGDAWRVVGEDCAPRRLWKALRRGDGPLPENPDTKRIRADLGTGVLERLSPESGSAGRPRGFRSGTQPLAAFLLKNYTRGGFVEARSAWRSTVGELCWYSCFPHSEMAVVDYWDRRKNEVQRPVAGAMKNVARSTWLWWPFAHGAVLCDRAAGDWWKLR